MQGTLLLYDGAKDPCGWDNNEPEVSLKVPLSQTFKNAHNSGGERKVALIVDKLEDITNHQDSLQLIRCLHVLSAGKHHWSVLLFTCVCHVMNLSRKNL